VARRIARPLRHRDFQPQEAFAMGQTHNVRLQPVDLTIEVDEDETILDAAFRQGVSLMHGCREGQCSACKSFLLDGDIQMDRYSTFALADYESEEGFVLLCKAHAYSDCEIELINFDEDELRDAVPLQQLRARIVELTDLTGDIVSLKLELIEPDGYHFRPGQYSDLMIPGTEEHRCFSMATTPSTPGQLEFIIKRYPGGHFSGLLETELTVGDELALRGPYGSFTIKHHSERDIVCIGGGAGMAPILSLLKHLVESGSFVPVLSEETSADWTSLGVTDGDFGFVTDVVDRREPDLSEAEVYVCGPPPMVDAAMAMLEGKTVAREHIYFDKFTTTVHTEA
jgi:propane monooxygenase reductase subunit